MAGLEMEQAILTDHGPACGNNMKNLNIKAHDKNWMSYINLLPVIVYSTQLVNHTESAM